MIRLRRLYAHDFKLLKDVDLRFPPRGRFLVRGLNESGKSTLFEAVFFGLFGQALAAETGRGRLDDLIRYGADEAEVGLEIEMPGRRLAIDRSIKRGRQNAWRLSIIPDTGPAAEPPVGNQAVNARIEQELGLDAEALLATCFVEQKKLDRLEGMTRAQREASLMRLLNLDRLVHMEETFRVRAPDRERVRELEQRRRLANLAADLPALEDRVAFWEARAAVHAALGAAERAGQAIRAAEEAAQARTAALGEEASLAELTRRAALLEEARAGFRASEEQLESARNLEEEASNAAVRSALRLRLARCAEVLDEARSAVAASKAELTELDNRIEETAQGLARLSATRSQRIEARAAMEGAAEAATLAAEDLRALEVREALVEWARASEAVQAARQPHPGAAAGGTSPLLRRVAIGTGAAASALIALRMAALGQTVGLALALLALAVCVWLLARRWSDTTGEVALQATAATDSPDAREAIARQRLTALNSVVPATAARARDAVAELDRRLGERTRAEVEADRLAAARAEAKENERLALLLSAETALLAEFGSVDGSALGRRRDAVHSVLVRRERFASKLAARLSAAGGDQEPGASYRDFAAAEADQAARASAALRARTDALAAWRRAWEALDAAGIGPEADVIRLRTADPDQMAADGWQALNERVVQDLTAVGGASTYARHQNAVRAAARADSEERVSLARRDAALAELGVALAGAARLVPQLRGLDRLSPAEIGDIQAALASYLPALPAESDTHAQEMLAAAREEAALLRHDLAALEGELGISAGEVDATAAAEAEAYMRELEVRERAAELVGVAANNVVRAILPSTMSYLRRMLPLLTAGRYFDARLTDDYQIEVWDDTAQGWRKKNIFSGGAKDQFSLALRLAFALATLPEERGAWPGFLFLDEPLGSFDRERAAALIDVLTEGEVAESFDQLFLVSHVAVPDRLFDYVITMSDGRVAESDLPE